MKERLRQLHVGRTRATTGNELAEIDEEAAEITRSLEQNIEFRFP